MSRTLAFDFRRGGGSPVEFLYGEVLLEATAMFTTGTSTVLPSPTRIPLVNGIATVTEVEESPSGATPAWVYNVTVKDSQTGRAWSRLIGVAAGTGALNFKDAPVYSTAGSAGPNVVVAPHSHAVATPAAAGFMSAADKAKLDGDLPASRLVWSQTAGRTLSVWDTINNRQQLVYGDTGWRDVTALGGAAVTGGVVRIKRDAQTVTLHLDLLKVAGTGAILDLPVISSGFQASKWFRHQLPFGEIIRIASGNLRLESAAAADTFDGMITWPAFQPWPTILPGVADGTISNT